MLMSLSVNGEQLSPAAHHSWLNRVYGELTVSIAGFLHQKVPAKDERGKIISGMGLA